MDASQALTLIPRLLIRLYQKVTVGLPPRCRFYPTCSEYVRKAMQSRGLFKGLLMGAWRILKCHPFHPGGYDPI